MRRLSDPQKNLQFESIQPRLRSQWEKIDAILTQNPAIVQLVHDDLCRKENGEKKKDKGAKGLTAEQILRFAIVMSHEQLSYRDVVDRVDDSIVLREFCRVPFGPLPAFTTLGDNIKRIRPETFEALNARVLVHALEAGVEDGKQVRMDSTATQSNIHHPTDAHLLWDGIRVLTRILRAVETDIAPLAGRWHDHTRAAKRLHYKINNVKKAGDRVPLYKRLLKLARQCAGYAAEAMPELSPEHSQDLDEWFLAAGYREELAHFTPLVEKAISQCERRVLRGEKVPANEKIVSIFEDHADIIVKGQREPVFGHKIFVSSGVSNLILQYRVEKGNPTDEKMLEPMLDAHIEQWKQAPEGLAVDGGFTSKKNAAMAHERGVVNVAFSSPKGLAIGEMAESERAYKKLRTWRAGIEAVISTVKRAYGLSRCVWKGFESFKAYIGLNVLAYNLHTLALLLLKQ